MSLRVLRPGCHGPDVARMQHFLAGQGWFEGDADGRFEDTSSVAVRAYQIETELPQTAIADQITLAAMIRDGLDLVFDPSMEWPPPPDWLPLRKKAEQKMNGWGRFTWQQEGRKITIEEDWIAQNIVPVECPLTCERLKLHRAVVEDYTKWMSAIKAAGLGHIILDVNESFSPRLMRGSLDRLSAHCWGICVDINRSFNRLGTTPKFRDQRGSVREIVTLANEFNFWWGGHNRHRRDGSHFEHCQPPQKDKKPSPS